MTELRAIADDLRAEQQALDDVVAGLSDEQWRQATPSPGWSVSDQIGHLTYFDHTAATAITDPEAFQASVQELMSGGAALTDATLHRDLAPAQLLEKWRSNRRALAEASEMLTEDTRVPWYGPSMSSKSFLTARLMETWAHGQDIVDTVGGKRPATDRLRHIAQLGFITRKWTYANRGLEPPEGDVRVELTGPSGDVWAWGPEGAAGEVRGPAEDFCLVVTQRRHVDDTDLVVTGDVARDWLEKAQAFAGPATDGPKAQRAAGSR